VSIQRDRVHHVDGRRRSRRSPDLVAAARAGGVLLVLLSAQLAAAQTPFSLFNIGADIQMSDARATGRGGWAMAEQDTSLPSFANIASLPGLTNVAVLFGGFAETRRSESSAETRRTRRVLAPNLRAAIPLMGGRGILTAGFQGRRATQYKTLVRRSIPPENGEFLYDREFIREGTQFDVPLGFAWRLEDRIAAGVSVNLIRGGIRELLNAFIMTDADSNGVLDYLPASQIMDDEFEGTSTTFSLLLTPHPRLRVGASYTPAHEIQVERRLELVGVAVKADSTFRLQWPEEWAVGAAVSLSDRWQAGLDYQARAFSGFTGREDWERDMLDEWSLGFGFERKHGQIRHGGLRNWPLRFGLTFRRWGYRLAGEEVRETHLSCGTGFPFREGGGHLDLAVSYGWLGDLEKNGLEDRLWRLTVSVAGLEKWW
jgi:hypothetical protein